MLEDLQIRNYSPNTVAAYIRRVAEFAKHFGKSPELLGPEEIREYQLYLIKDKTFSLSAYIQTVCGLRFLYSNTLHRSVGIDRIPLPRYEQKLPVISSPAEVQRLSCRPEALHGVYRLSLTNLAFHGQFAPETMSPQAGPRAARRRGLQTEDNRDIRGDTLDLLGDRADEFALGCPARTFQLLLRAPNIRNDVATRIRNTPLERVALLETAVGTVAMPAYGDLSG